MVRNYATVLDAAAVRSLDTAGELRQTVYAAMIVARAHPIVWKMGDVPGTYVAPVVVGISEARHDPSCTSGIQPFLTVSSNGMRLR